MPVRDVTDLHEEFNGDRVPPGQYETSDFPVLSKGEIPDWDPADWSFDVWGEVRTELSLDWEEFRALDSETQRQDFHCVTGWSRFDCEFHGVPFPVVADRAGITGEAVHVMFHALDGYTTDLPLHQVTRDEVLFAWEYNDEPLPPEHGGPLRVVTPHRYAYKGAKWVTGVELLAEPQRGYWEKRGYSQTANPWAEDRYG